MWSVQVGLVFEGLDYYRWCRWKGAFQAQIILLSLLLLVQRPALPSRIWVTEETSGFQSFETASLFTRMNLHTDTCWTANLLRSRLCWSKQIKTCREQRNHWPIRTGSALQGCDAFRRSTRTQNTDSKWEWYNEDVLFCLLNEDEWVNEGSWQANAEGKVGAGGWQGRAEPGGEEEVVSMVGWMTSRKEKEQGIRLMRLGLDELVLQWRIWVDEKQELMSWWRVNIDRWQVWRQTGNQEAGREWATPREHRPGEDRDVRKTKRKTYCVIKHTYQPKKYCGSYSKWAELKDYLCSVKIRISTFGCGNWTFPFQSRRRAESE